MQEKRCINMPPNKFSKNKKTHTKRKGKIMAGIIGIILCIIAASVFYWVIKDMNDQI
jgi:phosphotransferase system  glucose/maltose/N-acetylglucosamine-specific IIC component